MSDARSLLVSLAYLRVAAADPDNSARFATEIVGLQRGAADGAEVALRADDRARVLVYSAGLETALAIEAFDEAALDVLRSRLAEAGFASGPAAPEEARARRVHAALLVSDATGNALEIVARPQRSGRRLFGARDAGVVGLGNVALRSTDVAGDLRFWRALGAEVSDMSAISPISRSTRRIIASRSILPTSRGRSTSPSKSPRWTI